MKKIAPLFVGLGAISFGIPASLFKIARRQGVVNGPLLFWSFLSAVVILGVIQILRRARLRNQQTNWKQIGLVIAAGTASGFTNTFYIQALKLIPVAVAAVMLMQAVWLSTLLGAVIHHRRPSRLQAVSIVLVLIGTMLAAGLFPITQALSPWGLMLSFLAACSYACTMQFTASLGNNLDPLSKTWLLCLGAFILIAIVWAPQLITAPYHASNSRLRSTDCTILNGFPTGYVFIVYAILRAWHWPNPFFFRVTSLDCCCICIA